VPGFITHRIGDRPSAGATVTDCAASTIGSAGGFSTPTTRPTFDSVTPRPLQMSTRARRPRRDWGLTRKPPDRAGEIARFPGGSKRMVPTDWRPGRPLPHCSSVPTVCASPAAHCMTGWCGQSGKLASSCMASGTASPPELANENISVCTLTKATSEWPPHSATSTARAPKTAQLHRKTRSAT
jgi:hypothetical protein